VSLVVPANTALKLWLPTPGLNLKMAVPAFVSCAVPSRWTSVQDFAVASQKFTWPTVTGVLPAVTAAVSATTLPEAIVVTALPPEVTVRVVVVAGPLAIAGSPTSSKALNSASKQPFMQQSRRRLPFGTALAMAPCIRGTGEKRKPQKEISNLKSSPRRDNRGYAPLVTEGM
jgi:hypothetical protein